MDNLPTRKIAFGSIAAAAFGATMAMATLYRPWAFDNGIYDFGISDAFTNFGGVIALTYTSLCLRKVVNESVFPIIQIGLFCFVYELLQPALLLTFDVRDLFSGVLGTLFSILLFRYVIRNVPVVENA